MPLEPAPRSTSEWLLGLVAVIVGAVGESFAVLEPGSTATLVGNLVQLTLSGCAAVASLAASVRSAGRLRTAWRWIGVGVSGWFVGQLIWCYYELFADVETPFPSAADVGYLTFPVAATVGLWYFLSHQTSGVRLRNLLDGCVLGGSLLTISWSFVLETMVTSSGEGSAALLVSMSYPIGDVLFISMVIYGLSRPGPYRRTQALLAVAMLGMTVSDGAFSYLTAFGTYQTGGLFDLGWVLAFSMIAVAAFSSSDIPPTAAGPAQVAETPSMLPYLPLVLAAVVVAFRLAQGTATSLVEVVALFVAVLALLARQYITLLDNRNLMTIIAAREDDLRLQATRDLLTGLSNRALFTDRVSHALELHRRDMRPLALFFCDLDEFKAVNDTFGHPAGDELLIRVSERLRGALRVGDTLARFGGDEFAILVEDGGDAAQIGARIVDSLREPFTIKGSQLTVRASVGVIELRPDEASPAIDTLLTQADLAMYSAKRSGKGRLAIYEPTMTTPSVLDLPLQTPLSAAIAAGTISAHYQPVVALDDDRIVGLESFPHWVHKGVVIPLGDFVSLAIRSGLISALTTTLLERACSDIGAWSRRLGHSQLKIAANVAPSLISDPGFPARIAATLLQHGIAPEQLVLELTEEALLGDIETARAVTAELSSMGIVLALDNFGIGYSSLLHLQKIPLRILKIDPAFVADMDRDSRSEQSVRALLSLGRELGLDVVAEGVERQSQADLLRSLGCPFAQGRYFADPVPAELIGELLDPSLTQPR